MSDDLTPRERQVQKVMNGRDEQVAAQVAGYEMRDLLYDGLGLEPGSTVRKILEFVDEHDGGPPVEPLAGDVLRAAFGEADRRAGS